MLIGVPRKFMRPWMFRILTHWRTRRIIGEVCCEAHWLYPFIYRAATPREQMADYDSQSRATAL